MPYAKTHRSALLAFAAFMILAACGEARVESSTALCASDAKMGDECGGGVIYQTNYVAPGNTLVAALVDETSGDWKTSGDTDTSNVEDYVDGRNNTGASNSDHPAWMACENSVVAGYNDWYLPSLNELTAIWTNIALVPNLVAAAYWSSTEGATVTRAEDVDMGSGANGQTFKTTVQEVRCIRRLSSSPFTG